MAKDKKNREDAMEIIGSNLSEKEQKNKRMMKWIIIMIIILLLISIALGIVIFYLRGQAFKFTIDGTSVNTSQMPSDLFIFEGEEVYVSIRDIASYVGYRSYNGGYRQYTEKTNQCYVQNANEVCTFEQDSTTIYKNAPDEMDYEAFELALPVVNRNNKLYTTIEGISLACNLSMAYDAEDNRMTIYTLPYLVNYYTTNMTHTVALDDFQNQKALRYGLVVVQDAIEGATSSSNTTINYGIYSTTGQEIVGMRYTGIEFVEGNQEFIVTTREGKVGIVTADGSTKVNPQYDSLKQIDRDLNMYLAEVNGKYGVIERNGKILIYPEYDQIGINAEDFPSNEIKNQYILYENAIPVQRDGRWGLYDVRGNLILPIEYAGFGCIANNSTNTQTINNLLLIPEIKAIVVSRTYTIENNRNVTYYGLVNYLGKELIVPALTTIYSVTENNRDTYSMLHNGNTRDVLEYINTYVDIETLNEEEQTNLITTNSITNTAV